jgi:NTE family protein
MPIQEQGSQNGTPQIDYPQEGVALCLSGGGYRAMLFHIGTLWRLFEAGKLHDIERISSVSGGSITAGVLAMNWDLLSKSSDIEVLKQYLVSPVRKMASTTIDWKAVVLGLLTPGGAGRWIEYAYSRYLFGKTTLHDLPDRPWFVINATNVQSGVLWRFMKPYMRDYRVGEIKHPMLPLAAAVTASSSFPPVLSPYQLNLKESDFTPNTGEDLQYPPYTTKVMLTDGGVYDNLGLEPTKRNKSLWVSDGGAKVAAEPKPSRLWPLHAYRVLNLIDNQVGSLRKRKLIADYEAKPDQDNYRDGAYWGIRSNIDKYDVPDTLPCPYEKTITLANIKTRLKAMPDRQQEMLINWGYAVCDAALRKYIDQQIAPAEDFPYPDVGVG